MTRQDSTGNSFPSRRDVLIGGAAMAAVTTLPAEATASSESLVSISNIPKQGEHRLTTITTKDGTQIYYQD